MFAPPAPAPATVMYVSRTKPVAEATVSVGNPFVIAPVVDFAPAPTTVTYLPAVNPVALATTRVGNPFVIPPVVTIELSPLAP